MELLMRRCRGVVREFNRVRRCGTIEMESGERAFVRYSAITGAGLRVLQSGDQVSFDLEQGVRGLNAVRVVRD
jgi:cold shock protein